MLELSREVLDFCNRRLEQAAIAKGERPDWRKWMRPYLDFCEKYAHPPRGKAALVRESEQRAAETRRNVLGPTRSPGANTCERVADNPLHPKCRLR